MMRNRTPTQANGNGTHVVYSPYGEEKDKYGNRKQIPPTKIIAACVVLGLLFVFMSSGSGDSATISQVRTTKSPAAAVEDEGEQEIRRATVEKKPDGTVIVRDADGDIITDDTLAKDVIEGRYVDAQPNGDEDLVEDSRWRGSATIPEWLKAYFEWHYTVRKGLTEENWRDHNYLVMTCLGENRDRCGNVAHRLRPIMGMLRIAAESQRIFMIHWDKPYRLEDYLHPPQHGGIDWTVPPFVMWKVRKSPAQISTKWIHQQAMQEDRRVVNTMFHDDSYAEPYYNDRRKPGELPAAAVFKDTWNVLFKPHFLLQERVKETLELMGLKPGEYAAAHIDYDMVPHDVVERNSLRLKVEQAMNCLSNIKPGGPYFVAAHTYDIAREAMLYGDHHNVVVETKQIAHDSEKVPLDLYISFIEIYLMANARCVAFHRGGYGQLGYMLGYDFNCRIKYSQDSECQWTDPQPLYEPGRDKGKKGDKKEGKEEEGTKAKADKPKVKPKFMEHIKPYEEAQAYEDKTKPKETEPDVKPASKVADPAQEFAKLADEYDAKPAQEDAKPAEEDPKPAEEDPKSGQTDGDQEPQQGDKIEQEGNSAQQEVKPVVQQAEKHDKHLEEQMKLEQQQHVEKLQAQQKLDEQKELEEQKLNEKKEQQQQEQVAKPLDEAQDKEGSPQEKAQAEAQVEALKKQLEDMQAQMAKQQEQQS